MARNWRFLRLIFSSVSILAVLVATIGFSSPLSEQQNTDAAPMELSMEFEDERVIDEAAILDVLAGLDFVKPENWPTRDFRLNLSSFRDRVERPPCA